MAPKPQSPSDSQKTPTNMTSVPRKPSESRKPLRNPQLFVLEPAPRRNDRTNRLPAVAPLSGHKGPHRDGYSEEKCRSILVRECSKIPRNLNYIDGIHKVVAILRTHLGDENLDLSLGVLYEFIEVNDTTDTWEESSAYRRWSHDHSLRKVRRLPLSQILNLSRVTIQNSAEDFCCAHTLRLRNIVVGAIQPTERLRQWREHQKRQDIAATESPGAGRPSFSQSPDISRAGSLSRTHGIRNRHSWQINHSLYVSSPNKGTNVLYCPTPTKLNEMAFNEGIARGQRHHAGTLPGPKAQLVAGPPVSSNNMPNTPPPTPLPLIVKGKASIIKRGCQAILSPLRHRRSKKARIGEDYVALTHTADSTAASSDNAFDETTKEAELMNGPTRTYNDDDGTIRIVQESVPLPPSAKVNGAFSRKFGLVDYESQLPGDIETFAMDTAEDKVLRDQHALKLALKDKDDTDASLLNITTSHIAFNGPFTAELFKDGGLDFRWKPATTTVIEDEADAISPAPAR